MESMCIASRRWEQRAPQRTSAAIRRSAALDSAPVSSTSLLKMDQGTCRSALGCPHSCLRRERHARVGAGRVRDREGEVGVASVRGRTRRRCGGGRANRRCGGGHKKRRVPHRLAGQAGWQCSRGPTHLELPLRHGQNLVRIDDLWCGWWFACGKG